MLHRWHDSVIITRNGGWQNQLSRGKPQIAGSGGAHSTIVRIENSVSGSPRMNGLLALAKGLRVNVFWLITVNQTVIHLFDGREGSEQGRT